MNEETFSHMSLVYKLYSGTGKSPNADQMQGLELDPDQIKQTGSGINRFPSLNTPLN